MADVKEVEVQGEREEQIDAVDADEGSDSEYSEVEENDVSIYIVRFQLVTLYCLIKTLVLWTELAMKA